MNARTILAAGLAALVTVAVSAQAQERSAAAWTVPDIGALPDDKFGKMVRLGRELVERTYAHLGPEVVDPAKRYAGNNLSCNTCHLDAGARKFGNPFIGASADFPQYRPREDAIGTIEDRINGCMERSMNGRKLPVDSQEMKAMSAYMKFMSTGVPVGARIEGRGTLKMKLLDRAADPVAGRNVYAQYCTSCHGADGAGVRAGRAGDALGYTFPPLWGADTYNTGAGMHRVILAANFIKSNMPKGVTHESPMLTDEQAFDVAAYINSQARPEKANLDADFPARKNKPVDAAFAPYRTGFSAEQHKYGPFKPIVAAREQEIKAVAK